MTIVVFSKDRAMQLDAFLRSYQQHVSPLSKVSVLYLATTLRHAAAYADVFKGRESWVVPTAQTCFREDVLRLLPRAGTVTFFVDDQVFVRPWAQQERPGLSLRLGWHLTRNYMSNDAPQPLPRFEEIEEFLTWRWQDGEMAWRYPLSLDGHVFDAAELRNMLEGVAFASPNTLESAMQAYLPRFLPRMGLCYRESKVVNVPWTLVQTDWKNRYAGLTVGTLLDCWEQGSRIDLTPLYGVLNESVHQEFPLTFEAR